MAISVSVSGVALSEAAVVTGEQAKYWFLDFDRLKSFSQIRKGLDGKKNSKWTAAALEQLDQRFKELNIQVAEDSKPKVLSTTVVFDGGGFTTFVFVPPSFSPFEIHELIRKEVMPTLKREREEKIRVQIDLADTPEGLRLSEAAVSGLAELAVLAQWEAPTYGKRASKSAAGLKKKTDKKIEKRLSIVCEAVRSAQGKPALSGLISRGQLLGVSNNTVRTLALMPSNELHPDQYLELVRERSRSRGYQVDYLDSKKLKSLKAGAFLAVIQGSPEERGGILHLQPKKSKAGAKKIAIVGKGLCFDTGGVNVKTGSYMNGMHRDMTGSAVALALFEACLEADLPIEVHAFLALAENLISPLSYRPNDVVVASDGTSIEVVDTDAEGRMVLADTLAIARKIKPHFTLDFATLTGAAVRSIGHSYSAVFSNRDDLRDMAVRVGMACGERVWGFPIGGDFNEALKSEHADILQCSSTPGPDHIHAATFLSRFIGEESPWLHCDLSAEERKGGLGLVDTETTGFGVRFGLAMIESVLRLP